LVKGDDVAQKLLKLIGLKTSPSKCDEDTIRYIFGNHTPEKLAGGLEYYKNAAHRPMNETEADEDLKKFRPLL
jgi:nucleoside diphosphate kinase